MSRRSAGTALGILLGLVVAAELMFGAEPSMPPTENEAANVDKAVPDEAAIARVLNSPLHRTSNAETFFEAATLAYSDARIERAALFYYIAQIRAAIDLKAYEPTERGGNSPMVAIDAISQLAGAYINPAVTRDREMFARVVPRVMKWTPAYSSTYSPGWNHKTGIPRDEFDKLVEVTKSRWLKDMTDMQRLLQDDEYYQLFRLAQDFNFRDAERLPWDPQGTSANPRVAITRDEYDAAETRMREIEKRLGGRNIVSPVDRSSSDLER